MRYRTIVVDPPWSYQNKWQQEGKGNAKSHDGLAGIFRYGGRDGLYKAGIRGAAANYPCLDVDMVESMSPGPWLDVFARRLRMGWACYGNEVYNVPGLPQVGIEA